MPRALTAESLFESENDDGTLVRVTERGLARQLWFLPSPGDGDGRGQREPQLQTEVFLKSSTPKSHCPSRSQSGGQLSAAATSPGFLDVQRSLRRTPYLRIMVERLAAGRSKQRVLLLGLGGGLLAAALHHAGVAEVHSIEQSALVTSLARRYFCAPPPSSWLTIHTGCAQRFVLERTSTVVPACEPLFDACAIDVFTGASSGLPPFTMSSQFHQALRRMLAPGALVLQNAIAHSGSVVGLSEASRRRQFGHDMERCQVWCRNAAPCGPLRPAAFSRDNRAGAELERLLFAFREAYGGSVEVHRPCAWAPSRIVEAHVPLR